MDHVVVSQNDVSNLRRIVEDRLFFPHVEPNLQVLNSMVKERRAMKKNTSSISDIVLLKSGRDSTVSNSANDGIRISEEDWNGNQGHIALLENAYLKSHIYSSIKRIINESMDAHTSTFESFTTILEEKPKFMEQCRILCHRSLKILFRNPYLLTGHYTVAVIIGFLCGFLFWHVTNDLAGFQNRLGVFFFLCTLFAFSCLTSIQTFAEEKMVFYKERANKYYSPLAYFVSKVFIFN
jgi:hypothetical protein